VQHEENDNLTLTRLQRFVIKYYFYATRYLTRDITTVYST